MGFKEFICGSNNKSWWSWLYLIDWIAAALLIFISFILERTVSPYRRYLPENDPSVSYPLEADIVPAWALFIVVGVIPVIVFLVFQFFVRDRHDFHHAFLGLVVATSICLIITVPMKLMAGRYRPFYIHDEENNDARASFPSGHSSTGFNGMTFLALYLMGKTKLFSEHSGATFLKALGCISPFFVSIFVAVSRTMDYHHNFSDIVAGACIGVFSGCIGYFLYFPSIFSSHCESPRRKIKLQMHKVPTELENQNPAFRQIEEDIERAMNKNQFSIEVEDD